MPNWGLTTDQRETRPWGLDPNLLKPCKTITDPVHGDIYLNRLETLIIDSPPMQRLRRVRQLGTTQLAYPGATQSRFSHVLGTLRAAQDLLDAVWNSQINPQAKDLDDNLIAEWRQSATDGSVLNREFAKATVLARLGGLMHDLCHIPLGHTIEDDLGVLTPHDADVARFELLWGQLAVDAKHAIEGAGKLLEELRVLIISKDDFAKAFKSEYPFVHDIVGNTICADLIDYIQRDHLNTGLPLALGHRFLDSFYVVPSGHPYFARRMVINIDRDGRQREDIVTELVKYLRYRYELTERVLTHHAKTAADAMLGKMLELWRDDVAEEVAAELAQVGVGDALSGPSNDATDSEARVAARVSERIQCEFLARSDDGILEFIAQTPPSPTKRRAAAASLATALLNRSLYKRLGHAGTPDSQAVAEQAYKRFASDPRVRRELEEAAAKFAGLDHGWHCVLWLPSPSMRLKVADVLVHHAGTIAPLSKIEATSRDIAEQHQRLWAATVYGPGQVRDDPRKSDAVLAYIGEATGLQFKRPDGSAVPSTRELAVERILSELGAGKPSHQELLALTPNAKGAETFEQLVAVIRIAAEENELLPPHP